MVLSRATPKELHRPFGCCRRDLARDLLADLRRIDRHVRDNEAQMCDALAGARTALTAVPGLAP
jgi:hypothetical protein